MTEEPVDLRGREATAGWRGLRRHPAAFVVAIALLAMGIVSLRVVMDARAALKRAQAAEKANERAQAVAGYLEAARAYLPGNGYSRAAFDRLWALAGEANKAGRQEDERAALEAFRAAALGARSFFTPRAEEVAQADVRLAELLARLELSMRARTSLGGGRRAAAPRLGSNTAGTLTELRAYHLERLTARPGPSFGRVLMALTGFLLWVAAVILFILRGLSPAIRVQTGAATVSAIAFIVGFTLFVLGLAA